MVNIRSIIYAYLMASNILYIINMIDSIFVNAFLHFIALIITPDAVYKGYAVYTRDIMILVLLRCVCANTL